MDTLTTTNAMKHIIDINTRKTNAKIVISTERDYFSITGTFWKPATRVKNRANSRTDKGYMLGGCCHDEILQLRPDLQPFVDLHLSDMEGVPLHAVANGMYHINEGMEQDKFCALYRVTPQQYTALNKVKGMKGDRATIIYCKILTDMGIFEQWKAQAEQAKELLKQLTQ